MFRGVAAQSFLQRRFARDIFFSTRRRRFLLGPPLQTLFGAMAAPASDIAPDATMTPLQQAFTEASRAWKSTGALDLKADITELRAQRESLKKAAKATSKEMKVKRQKVSRAKKHTAKVPTDDLLQLVAERLCHAQTKAEHDVAAAKTIDDEELPAAEKATDGAEP